MIHRTGILGGTFDPVHNGHLALASAAGNLCKLSEVVLLPAAVPPHKQSQKIAPFHHRLAMLRIAAKDKPLLHVSALEELLPSPSFTLDTLHYLNIHSVGKTEFYFIIGADAFLEITSWYKYEEVLGLSHFILFSRTGCENKKLYKLLRKLHYREDGNKWHNKKYGTSIYTSTLSLPSASSSKIRKRIAKSKSVKNLVPTPVSEYIKENNLYRG